MGGILLLFLEGKNLISHRRELLLRCLRISRRLQLTPESGYLIVEFAVLRLCRCRRFHLLPHLVQ